MGGGWTSVHSSWVDAILYDQGTLFVRFRKGGAVVQYNDYYPLDFYLAFLSAPSKGKFVWAHLYDKSYTLVSG